MKGALFIAVIFAFCMILSTGCTSQPSDQVNAVSTENSQETGTAEDYTSGAEEEQTAQAGSSSSSETELMYPDAYGRGERVYFNDKTNEQYSAGDSKITMSIYTESTKTSNGFYVKNMDTGEKAWIKPASGNKFVLLSVTVAPMGAYSQTYISPYTSDFMLIDGSNEYSPILEICDDPSVIIKNKESYDEPLNEEYVFNNIGEIYVGQNIYRSLNKKDGSGSKSGWLLFEVPDSFEVTKDTYLEMDLGNDDVHWKLFDIIASIVVSKSPTTGDITVRFDGGTEAQVIGSINVDVTLPDGTTNSDSITADGNQIPIGSEMTVSGSKPGEGEDHVVVYFIRSDGSKIIKYDDYLSAAARI